MIFTEIKGNLFNYTKDRAPVHCISKDCMMGAGIAPLMKSTFNLWGLYSKVKEWPSCVYYNGVLNLVTKEHYYDKPTYESFKKALTCMKNYLESFGIKRIVMPRIGCGLDKLEWEKVREYIKEVFEEMDIDILVCSL